jgi:tetratricopeptide (TPR) repeat protein
MDNMDEAYNQVGDPSAELAEAQAAAQPAQDAVDDLQGKLDNFMANHVFVDGVSGDPSEGPNHINYHGVNIYWSDHQMFSTVFDLIKDGIKSIAERLAVAKAISDSLQSAVDAAQKKLDDAIIAKDQAEAAEQEAWDDLQDAYDFYNEALDAYYKCLEDRKACIEANPDDCAGVPLIPEYTEPEGSEVPSQPTEDIFDPDFWDGLFGSILDGIQNEADEAAGELEQSESRLDEATGNVESSGGELDQAFGELEGSIGEYADWIETLNDLLSDIPDGAWILTYNNGAPEGYGVEEVGDVFIYYRTETEPEVENWINENNIQLEGLGTPPVSDPNLIVPYIINYADALDEFTQASGDKAGAEARLEEIPILSQLLGPMFDSRSGMMDEKLGILTALQAQIDSRSEE